MFVFSISAVPSAVARAMAWFASPVMEKITKVDSSLTRISLTVKAATVLTERVSVLLTVLELLAASVNVLLATEMTPLVVLLGVGVKVAV